LGFAEIAPPKSARRKYNQIGRTHREDFFREVCSRNLGVQLTQCAGLHPWRDGRLHRFKRPDEIGKGSAPHQSSRCFTGRLLPETSNFKCGAVGESGSRFNPAISFFRRIGSDTEENDAFRVPFRLGEDQVRVSRKRPFVREMMIGRKKVQNCRRINPVKMGQAVRDSRRSPVVMRLDQQAFGGEAGQSPGEEAFHESASAPGESVELRPSGIPAAAFDPTRFCLQ